MSHTLQRVDPFTDRRGIPLPTLHFAEEVTGNFEKHGLAALMNVRERRDDPDDVLPWCQNLHSYLSVLQTDIDARMALAITFSYLSKKDQRKYVKYSLRNYYEIFERLYRDNVHLLNGGDDEF